MDYSSPRNKNGAPRPLPFQPSLKSALIAGAVATWLLLPPQAMAVDALPGGIEGGQLEKRFDQPPVPRAIPPVLVPEEGATMAPEEASRIHVQLQSVILEGATVFSEEEIRPLYADLLQRNITLLDVYQLATRLTAFYGNRGYLLARAFIPPQTIKNGEVRIAVVEGYVDRVVFEGTPPHRAALFDYYAERIRESRPLRAAVLERYALLANDLAGVNAQVVLRPSLDNSGAATLVMDLRQRRYDGSLSIDNHGTEAVGPWQLLAEANANSFFKRYDRTTLRFATTPEASSELRYLFLGHAQVVNAEGTTVRLATTHSSSKPGTATLRALQVKTNSTSIGLSLTHPWVRSRSRNHSISAALDYRGAQSELLGATTSDDQLYVFRAALVNDWADRWAGQNLLSFTLNRGLSAFGARVDSRTAATPHFTSLAIQAARRQPIAESWALSWRLAAQAAPNSLPSSELFGLGGEAFGRGYDPSEWVGDQGAATSIDLVFQPQVSWVAAFNTYLFVDHGTVLRRNPVNEPGAQLATSAGLGVQAASANGFTYSLMAARPLGERANASDKQEWRVFGRVTAHF